MFQKYGSIYLNAMTYVFFFLEKLLLKEYTWQVSASKVQYLWLVSQLVGQSQSHSLTEEFYTSIYR